MQTLSHQPRRPKDRLFGTYEIEPVRDRQVAYKLTGPDSSYVLVRRLSEPDEMDVLSSRLRPTRLHGHKWFADRGGVLGPVR
jgi:hypothetical protein